MFRRLKLRLYSLVLSQLNDQRLLLSHEGFFYLALILISVSTLELGRYYSLELWLLTL